MKVILSSLLLFVFMSFAANGQQVFHSKIPVTERLTNFSRSVRWENSFEVWRNADSRKKYINFYLLSPLFLLKDSSKLRYYLKFFAMLVNDLIKDSIEEYPKINVAFISFDHSDTVWGYAKLDLLPESTKERYVLEEKLDLFKHVAGYQTLYDINYDERIVTINLDYDERWGEYSDEQIYDLEKSVSSFAFQYLLRGVSFKKLGFHFLSGGELVYTRTLRVKKKYKL